MAGIGPGFGGSAGTELLAGGGMAGGPAGGFLASLTQLLGDNPKEQSENALALSKLLQGFSTQVGALNSSTLGPRFLQMLGRERAPQAGAAPPGIEDPLMGALGGLNPTLAAQLLQSIGLT